MLTYFCFVFCDRLEACPPCSFFMEDIAGIKNNTYIWFHNKRKIRKAIELRKNEIIDKWNKYFNK